MLCADKDKHCVWRIDPSSGNFSLFAGGVEGESEFHDGYSNETRLRSPLSLAVSGSCIYVTVLSGHIKKIRLADGAVSTVSNCRTRDIDKTGDFPCPLGIVAKKDGRFLVTCSDSTIREIDVLKTDSIRILAGVKNKHGNSDGHCGEARFHVPFQIAVGPDGSVYVIELRSNAVRKMNSSFQVETIRKNSSKPSGVAVDDEGNVYICDNSYKIYKLAPSGIETVCGSGEKDSIDGRGALASLKMPQFLFYDSKSGFLYFTEPKALRRVRVATPFIHDPKLSPDLAKFIDGSDNLPVGDAVFLVEGKRIKVCAKPLCVRSEYFSSMFSSNWKEISTKDASESTPIRIEEATYEAFHAVITYLVTGCLEVRKYFRIIPDILVLADRYLVENLREFCISHMARRVSIETALDYLSLADRFSFRELRKTALQFAAKNFKTLCHDDRFAALGGELLAEIMRVIASSSSSEEEH